MEFAKEMHIEEAECNLAFSGISCPFSLQELGVTSAVLNKVPFYPYGNPQLKDEIAGRYKVRSEQILLPGGGSSLCNFLIGAALLDKGDKALIETPTYECLREAIASTGAEIIPFSRRPENAYDLDLDEIKRLLDASVKLIVITRLHNPSGRDIAESTLLQVAELAASCGAYVLVDEVYLEALPAGSFNIAAALHPRMITTSSLTKIAGMGDLRIGWAIAPPEIVWRCCRINNVLGVNPPVVADLIALHLFQSGGLDKVLQWSQHRAAENWEILEKYLRQSEAFHWVKPDGGIIAFLRIEERQTSDTFVAVLKEKYKTLVMPGRFFDLPEGFRLGFGCTANELQEGLRRITLALKETKE
jgi:aspartate/methionine/tyrosine aminotransferase